MELGLECMEGAAYAQFYFLPKTGMCSGLWLSIFGLDLFFTVLRTKISMQLPLPPKKTQTKTSLHILCKDKDLHYFNINLYLCIKYVKRFIAWMGWA